MGRALSFKMRRCSALVDLLGKNSALPLLSAESPSAAREDLALQQRSSWRNGAAKIRIHVITTRPARYTGKDLSFSTLRLTVCGGPREGAERFEGTGLRACVMRGRMRSTYDPTARCGSRRARRNLRSRRWLIFVSQMSPPSGRLLKTRRARLVRDRCPRDVLGVLLDKAVTSRLQRTSAGLVVSHRGSSTSCSDGPRS